METIILHSITTDEFFENIRLIIREELKTALQQDLLLTKEAGMKITGASNADFLRAVNEGTVIPQLIKGRKKAMYLESQILKINVRKKRTANS